MLRHRFVFSLTHQDEEESILASNLSSRDLIRWPKQQICCSDLSTSLCRESLSSLRCFTHLPAPERQRQLYPQSLCVLQSQEVTELPPPGRRSQPLEQAVDSPILPPRKSCSIFCCPKEPLTHKRKKRDPQSSYLLLPEILGKTVLVLGVLKNFMCISRMRK